MLRSLTISNVSEHSTLFRCITSILRRHESLLLWGHCLFFEFVVCWKFSPVSAILESICDVHEYMGKNNNLLGTLVGPTTWFCPILLWRIWTCYLPVDIRFLLKRVCHLCSVLCSILRNYVISNLSFPLKPFCPPRSCLSKNHLSIKSPPLI